MDINSLITALDGISIVAWFALLVVVFAVFVGLGIYQGRRGEAQSDATQSTPVPAPLSASTGARQKARPKVHQKEFT
jgi:hypothetical protein